MARRAEGAEGVGVWGGGVKMVSFGAFWVAVS